MPVMFANLARAVAASSDVMFVASPSITIVFVNCNKLSFLIPSWPAASATDAIAVAD